MARTSYKVGICIDGKRHAEVRRLLVRRQALCGAGRIVIKMDGEFDPGDLLSCRRCRQLVLADDQVDQAEPNE